MWRRVVQRTSCIAHGLGGALFVMLFGVFVLQVVSRFAFDRPLPWTDELAVVLYVWIILWACATMVPTREHVMFDLVWNSASSAVRRFMRMVGHTLIGEPVDDAGMLELLEPFTGQRGRVVRLCELYGSRPARRGPRMSVRDYRAF